MFSTVVVYALFLAVLLFCGYYLGYYISVVFSAGKTPLDIVCRPLAKCFYALAGVQPDKEMTWWQYAKCVLAFSLVSLLAVFVLLLAQQVLPLNPQHIGNMNVYLALNTAVSFMTNTNWQAYAGESGASYLSQMLAFTVQNFLSAAVGLAVAIALIRGLQRRTSATIGNFWSDLTIGTLWILLPFSILLALVFVSQGVIQNFSAYLDITGLEGVKQTLALGPVASQEAIKLFGTNGGGFFNANSAHPFENPTPFSNYLSIFSILILPTALVFAFGRLVRDKGQGRATIIAMLLVFVIGLAVIFAAENSGNPILAKLHIAQPTAMEGKEVRFGIADSALFANATTDVSCGAVNSMHDSYMPLSGMMLLLNMMLGEVIFGGVGSGFYGILLFVIKIVGLMVGRTPEYLGKKVELFEMKMAVVGILVPGAGVLFGAALGLLLPAARDSIAIAGPHGLSEVLYAFASTTGNNGSAFAGLNANTPFYNLATAVCMLFGRFAIIVPVLAIAGSFAAKKHTPPSAGTFSTSSVLFALLLAVVILIVGGLTFIPALALGPVLEHLKMVMG